MWVASCVIDNVLVLLTVAVHESVYSFSLRTELTYAVVSITTVHCASLFCVGICSVTQLPWYTVLKTCVGLALAYCTAVHLELQNQNQATVTEV